jgi:hypothetical protein
VPALCRLCPKDPLLAHERGCVALRAGNNVEAEEFLRQALHLAGGGLHVGAPSKPVFILDGCDSEHDMYVMCMR